jgi:hypothetical protein
MGTAVVRTPPAFTCPADLMSTTRAVWLFIAVLTAIRLSILPITDLEFDEAHYWLWSQHLAPAYFSKGPGIAFFIRASTAVFGSNEFGVRFFSPILGAGTSLLLFYFARRLFSDTAGLWAVLALNTTPLFNMGAFLMTIDPLSIFFWLAAMFSFWIAVEKSPAWSWHWPLSGLLIGFGFLCKYTNALELLSIVLVLALVPRLRPEFARPGLYVLLGTFAVCTIPPIIWNAQHVWVTLTHLQARGSLSQGFGIHPTEVLAFIGEHFLFYSPLLFLALAWGVIGSCRRVGQQLKVLFLFWFGLPVFAFYFLLSFNKVAAPNWDALAMLGFGLLAVHFWRERLAEHGGLRIAAGAALLVGLLMSALALDTDIVRSLGFEFWRSDPSDRMRGWKSATAAAEKIRADLESKNGERVFLIADARDRASEISFYLRDKKLEGPGHPPVYIIETQDMQNQFSFWPRYDEFVEATPGTPRQDEEASTEGNVVNPFVGRNALFIREGVRERIPHNIRTGFQSVEPVAVIEVWRYGNLLRKWQVFLCHSYRTLPL